MIITHFQMQIGKQIPTPLSAVVLWLKCLNIFLNLNSIILNIPEYISKELYKGDRRVVYAVKCKMMK